MITDDKSLRCWAEIDLDAIRTNFAAIRRIVPADKKLLAVVKADAYGHGADMVSLELADLADFFGVAEVGEALGICRAYNEEGEVVDPIKKPVLILGYTHPSQFPILVKYDIRPAIFHYDDAVALNECAKKAGKCAPIHIAVDTGMSRIGFPVSDEGIAEALKIAKLENIRIEGIFSHFANADSTDKAYTEYQLENFRRFTGALEENGVHIPIRHLFNSAGTIELAPEFEMMREGIVMYGLHPSDEVDMAKVPEVSPAMAFRARIAHVKTVEAGVSVSYGCTYTTSRTTKIATVCAGYADGVPRSLSNKASVLICGKRAPIIGRVCMDQLMVDVTDIPECEIGGVATIFGKDGGDEIFADDLAEMAGTIGYELICGINKRVTRLYYRNKKGVAACFGIAHEYAEKL